MNINAPEMKWNATTPREDDANKRRGLRNMRQAVKDANPPRTFWRRVFDWLNTDI